MAPVRLGADLDRHERGMTGLARSTYLASAVSDQRAEDVSREGTGFVDAFLRHARTACAALAAAHVVAFLVVALARIRYPFDLEWLEGGILQHSYEMLAGRPVYRTPSADFIAFGYQPLYMAVVAALGRFVGLSLPLARGVSLASTLVVTALVGRAVWRETGSVRLAWMAGATFVALFRVTGYWFDLARVDSLFLALLLAALYCARYVDRPWRACLGSAVLLILAYKTKQLALPFAVIVPATLFTRDRRAALAFIPTIAVPLLLDAWWGQRTTGGWYSFYVSRIPSGQPFHVVRIPAMLSQIARDVPWLVVLAVPGCARALRIGSLSARFQQTWALAAIVGIVATVVPYARPGGFANNLMTTYVFAIIPAFVELHRAEQTFAPGVKALLWGALGAQLVLLGYDPSSQIPKPEDYAAGEELVAMLRATPGPVLVPDRPWIAVLAGKQPGYHSSAFWEMSYQDRDDLIPTDLRQRLASGYYELIVEGVDPARAQLARRWFAPELATYYRCDRQLRLPGRALSPFTGTDTTPRVLCVYRGR